MWIDYAVIASVIPPFWMNWIFDSVCYLCSQFFAAPFGSAVNANSSFTVLTVSIWMQYLRRGFFFFFFFWMMHTIFQLYNFVLMVQISHHLSLFWFEMTELFLASFWWKLVESNFSKLVKFWGTCVLLECFHFMLLLFIFHCILLRGNYIFTPINSHNSFL